MYILYTYSFWHLILRRTTITTDWLTIMRPSIPPTLPASTTVLTVDDGLDIISRVEVIKLRFRKPLLHNYVVPYEGVSMLVVIVLLGSLLGTLMTLIVGVQVAVVSLLWVSVAVDSQIVEKLVVAVASLIMGITASIYNKWTKKWSRQGFYTEYNINISSM